MPSKYEKERLKAKKEAAKKKGGKKVDDSKPAEETKVNGVSAFNGTSKESTPTSAANGMTLTYEEELCMKLEEEAR